MDAHIILVPTIGLNCPTPDAEDLHEWFYRQFSDDEDCKWITGWELGKKNNKWHYHATIYRCPLTRETLRARLTKVFQPPKKGLAITDIKNPEAVLSYTIKGGNYFACGFTQESIDEAMKASYDKEDVKDNRLSFKKVLKKIEDEYLMDKSTWAEEEFVERYIQAYLDYGKPIYLSHIKARLISIRLRKSPERLKTYVRDVLEDVGSGDYYKK